MSNITGAYTNQAEVFKALTHPVRLAILDILRDGEQCVCHMEAVLNRRQAFISQHLMVLREAGLVEDRRDGWNIFYRVVEPQVFELVDSVSSLLGETTPRSERLTRPAACPCPKCNPGQTTCLPPTSPPPKQKAST